ncbi:MAG: hypothetical protein VB023_06570 [Oscillibacter sp.]|nr:hypothetical protein [Oscillibacter sp.]
MLAVDLPEHGEHKGGEDRFNPWTAVPELKTVFAYMKSRWSEIGVRANSIGAHFSMLALGGAELHKALFVSPIVDMERLHPIQNWSCPTAILYAGQDNMSTMETVKGFANAHGSALTVYPQGEHWFHTPEQLAVLRNWEEMHT